MLVVLAHQGGGDWNIVTAREMMEKEKRLYRQVVRDK
jgi:hypothetical protein